MLEHEEIITKLNLPQKAKILSDFTANNSQDGIPFTPTKRFGKDLDFNVKNLANAWNADLWRNFSSAYCDNSQYIKGCSVILPESFLMTDNKSDGISEDAFLTRSFNCSMAKGAFDVGVRAYTDGLSADKEKLGLFKFSYENVAASAAYGGVDFNYNFGGNILTAGSNCDDNYKRYLFKQAAQVLSKESIVLKGLKGKDFIDAIVSGFYLFIQCEPYSIQRAVENYNAIKEQEERAESVDESEYNGEILDPNVLDEALDKLLGYLEKHLSEDDAVNGENDFSASVKNALRESFVLLKNDAALPLKSIDEVAFIGETGYKSYVSGLFRISGELCSLAEYNGSVSKYRNEIVNICRNIKKVVYFMQNRPIDQEIITRLKNSEKTIIVVQDCSQKYGISYKNSVSAILYRPIGDSIIKETLCEVLSGKISPSGALPFTIYKEPNGYFSTLIEDLSDKVVKTGVFTGYKRYTSDVELSDEVAFPFGYGITYNDFEYTKPIAYNGNLIFSIKNKGRAESYDTIQIYGTCNFIQTATPKKELIYFSKIKIGAGKKVNVSFAINDILKNIPKETRENCTYTLTIQSCSGKRLGQIEGPVKKTGSVNYKKSSVDNYFFSLSNISRTDYMLPVLDRRKATIKKYLWVKALLLISVVAMYIMIGNCIFDIIDSIRYTSSLYDFDIFRQMQWGGFISVVSISILCLVSLLITSRHQYGYALKEEKMARTKVYDLVGINEEELESIFYKETAKSQINNENAMSSNTSDEEAVDSTELKEDIVGFKSGFSDVKTAFKQFAEENGIRLSDVCVAKLLAAIASTRLIMLTQNDLNKKTIDVLQSYFGGGGASENAEELLIPLSVQSDSIRLGYVSGDFDKVSAFIKPFERFFSNCEKSPYIRIENENGATTGKIAEGTRIFACVEDGIEGFTSFAKDLAIISLNAEEIIPSEEKSSFAPIGNYYFDKAIQETVKAKFMDEKYWKFFDNFSELDFVDFGNKQYVKAEVFTSCMLSCGLDQYDVFDEAVSAYMLPQVLINNGIDVNKELKRILDSYDLPVTAKTAEKIINTENNR